MFRNLRNSRLGRYYSSILAKYGTIATWTIALFAFAVLVAAENFNVFGLLNHYSKTSYIVTIVVLSLSAALALYCMIGKLAKRDVGAADLIIYVLDVLAVLVLVFKLFVTTSSTFTALYIAEVVVAVLFTFLRMAVVKPREGKMPKQVAANSNIKTYLAALIKRFNPVTLLVAALMLFGLSFVFAGVTIEDEGTFVAAMAVTIALEALLVIFSMPKRLRSHRMNSVDAVIAFSLIATVLYVIPVILGFSVLKLVLWLIALILVVLFEILLMKKTYIEDVNKPEEVSGNKGFKVYFGQLASRHNIIVASVVAALVFTIVYSLLPLDVFRGVQTWAVGGFYIILDLILIGAFCALLGSASRSKIGFSDCVLYALGIFTLLMIIPMAQYFSVMLLVSWLLLFAVVIVSMILRAKNVVELQVENAEEYNPVRLFAGSNFVTIAKSVKSLFAREKDAHYISGKESRRIAKENRRVMKQYEKEKKRKNVPESEYVTQMRDDRNVVEFENLHTYFFSDAGVVKAVNGVTFDIPQGSTVGVIGESGCGKSVTSLSLMQLVQAPKGQVIKGSEIRFKSTVYKTDEKGNRIPVYEVQLDENGNEMHDENGEPIYVTAPKMRKGKPVLDKAGNPVLEKVQKLDANGGLLFETEEKVYNIAKMPTEVMRNIRGREISMIFQEPMTSLNPIFTIGKQLDEVVFLHIPGATKESAKARTFEMLKLVGIIPENVYKRYPHELSGGMRQRVMIAMSLLCNPKLIIADEPTTALDVTIQAQILDLLRDVKAKINGSIMFITHDLGVIAEMADYVVVMYAGRIIEMGTAKEIFDNPLHPYTMGLQKSKPAVNKKVDRLYSIPGSVPNPIDMPNYCYFRDRCDKRCAMCNGDYPEMIQVSPTHKVSCHLYEKEDLNNGK